MLRWLFLIVGTTSGAIAVVIFLGYQIHSETRKMATEQFNQQQLILARSAAAGIETYFNGFKSELFSLANRPGIGQMGHESLKALQHACSVFPRKTSIRLLDANGILRIIYPYEGWRKELTGKDYGKEMYFREVRKTRHAIVSRIINNEHGEPRIRMAVPIYRTNKTKAVGVAAKDDTIAAHIDQKEHEPKEFIGVVVGSLDPKAIARHFISPIVSGRTGYAWLLNQNGVFLSHHEEEFFALNAFDARGRRNPDISYEALEQIQREMLAGKEGIGRYISGWHRRQSGEIEKLAAYAPVHINGKTWSVAVCAPVSEVEEIVQITHRSEIYIITFVILSLIIGGILLFAASFRWTRSLELEVAKQTKELREANEYLDNLIRHTNAPIIVWNSDGQINIFNKAFEKMMGRSEAEVTALPPELMFPEETRSDSMKKLESAFSGDNWETVEIPILCKNGETRSGLWNSANIYDEEGKTVVATVAQGQDITERKRLAEERVKLETELQQAQKMESIGTLAGGIAHDFNNILSPIMMHSEMAMMDLPSGSPLQQNMKQIYKAGERARDLVKQILTFARRQEKEQIQLKVSRILKEVLKLLRSTLPTTIDIQYDINSEQDTVLADPTQLQQIIMNLCMNANHAMEEKGGTLNINFTNENLDSESADEFPDLDPGCYVKLTVTDTGHGIDPQFMDKIFEPYFTTKEVGKGTGMGLALVYGIVKSYGGAVTVQSESGKGTSFHVYLPLVEGDTDILETAQDSMQLPTGTERILFVDDEKAAVDVMQPMLEKLGYKVTGRTSSIEALEAFRNKPQGFDLVVTDMTMPNMTGKDLAEELMVIRPDIPIILCTGFSEKFDERRAEEMGISAYVMKPIVMRQIAQTIREVLGDKK